MVGGHEGGQTLSIETTHGGCPSTIILTQTSPQQHLHSRSLGKVFALYQHGEQRSSQLASKLTLTRPRPRPAEY